MSRWVIHGAFCGEGHADQRGHPLATQVEDGAQKSPLYFDKEWEAKGRNGKASRSPVGKARLGSLPGPALPHSLNESYFQSVHTYSLFRGPPLSSDSPSTLLRRSF